MKTTLKRLFSMMLVLCLMLSMLPVSAFANDTAVEQPAVQEEQIVQQEVQEEVKEEQTDSQTQEELTSEEEAEKTSEDVKTEPSEEEPAAEDGTEEESEVPEEVEISAFETFKKQIEELQNEAKALDRDSENFDAESEALLEKADAFDNAVIAAYEAGEISETEFNTLSQMSADFYQIVAGEENNNQVEDATTYYRLSQSDYRSTSKVYWDVMASYDEGGDSSLISSVKLNGIAVKNADSDSTSWSDGQTLSTYYPGVTNEGSGDEKTLTITPVTGYYVTEVVVACCVPSKPYNCNTWEDNNAFKKTFSLTASGVAECALHSKSFGHSSRAGNYFILIKVAPLPSPMYIEYDCGEMKTILDDAYTTSVFYDPDGWTAETSGNNKGSNGKFDTEDTQYEYAYLPDDESNVTQWVHYANTVTDAAKQAAAAKGYRFTGWSATYYNTCTDTTTPDDAGNNSTYAFSNNYSTNSVSYAEGARVALTTHVQLVAQWEKIPYIDVTVTKVWDDANNQAGFRPASITVNLKNNDVVIRTQELNAENEWTYTFTQLDSTGSYTVEEIDVPDVYTSSVSGSSVNGYTITNTYVPETVTVSGTKTWDDAGNQDGIRPEFITINLLANGEVKETKTVTEANGWAWSFENLPKHADAKEIVYTIAEGSVPGYTTEVNGYNVTNTHTPETIDIEGTKTWDDASNQDGLRPESITVKLMNGDTVVQTQTVTAAEDGTWTYSFTDLPKYANGVEIKYTITEDAVAGYEATVDGYNITNTHTPATVSVSGTKTWDDGNNQDGIRPGSITIKLWNGNMEVASKTVTAGDDWKWEFTNLPKFAAGVEIKYTITEVSVEGYETVVDGFDVTNTHIPETTEVTVTKIWDDKNDQDGIRPKSITVNLMNGEQTVGNAILNAGNEWKYTFKELPKKAAGKDIVYTVAEVIVPEGYTSNVDGYTITNTHEIEKTSVSGVKTWDDDNDRDGIRPGSITINLLANGENVASTTVTAENGWAWSFTDLDKFADGKEIVYTVSEEEVEGYTTAIEGTVITNTHEIETVAVEGTKTWDDNDNQDGIRPDSITVNLLADGAEINETTVNADGNWSYSFTGLPKYRDQGTEIVYTVTEDAVEGYGATTDGYNITNTHTPETITIEGTKTWDDNDNQDGKRPTSITVNLLADDTEVKEATVTATTNWNWEFTDLPKYRDGGVEIIYTVTEDAVAGYETAIEGYAITNTHEIEKTSISGTKIWDDNDNQDGKRPESITINLLADNVKVDSKVVSAEDGWAWTFDNLNKYNAGVEVKYSFTEEAVDEYTATYDGTEITNTHTPEETSVQVVKVWNDNNNQDGKRTNDVTIILVANSVETENTLVLNDSNGWKGTFTGLDKYENGEEIVYTVKEAFESEDYTSEITGSAAEGFTVTNTHEIEKINISGTKTWVDNDDQDGKRPDSITVNLLADGKVVDTKTVAPDADGDWVYSFVNLDKYAAGKEITYTITEDAVDGYNTIYDGYNITNKYEPEKTSVTVIKAWEDANDQDGLRPDSIKVTLLADGEKIGMLGKSLTLSEKNEWRGTFTDLDKYRDQGTEIVYTVVEEEVEGYEAVISGDASTAFVITNVHEPEVIELISGTKIWEDDNNRDGKRPESVTISLLANGAIVDTVTVTAADNWSYSFENLPKYEAGEEIVYTLAEETVEDYSTSYDGFDVVNSYTPGMTSIKVTKRWVDGHNADGIRPKSVTVYLYANGVEIAEMKLSKKNDWTGEFEDLYIYENGEKIEYTIKEKAVKGYNNTITGNAKKGFIVTNTHNVIPKTGDESNLPKYIGLFGASASVMAVLMFLAKPKKGKYAR